MEFIIGFCGVFACFLHNSAAQIQWWESVLNQWQLTVMLCICWCGVLKSEAVQVLTPELKSVRPFVVLELMIINSM